MSDINEESKRIIKENQMGKYGGGKISTHPDATCVADKVIVDAILGAAKDGEFDTVKRLFENMITYEMSFNYPVYDKDKKTLLIYLVSNRIKNPDFVDKTINNIFASIPDKNVLAELLNHVDGEGNTLLHYAVLTGNGKLSEKLISLGATSKIKNSEGMYVDFVDNPSYTKIGKDGDLISDNAELLKNAKNAEPLKNVKDTFPLKEQKNTEPLKEQKNGPEILAEKTEASIDPFTINLDMSETKENTQNKETDITTENFQKIIKNELDRESVKVPEKAPVIKLGGGASGTRRIALGGRSNERKLRRIAGAKTEKQGKNKTVKEIIPEQADNIHKQVISSIMKMLNVSEIDAIVYKTGLWKMTRERNPGLETYLNLSVALKDMVKRENLEKVNLLETKHSISKKDAVKNQSAGEKKNRRKKHESETSPLAFTPKDKYINEETSVVSRDRYEESTDEE
jgi:hypothetical protein